MFFSNAHWPQLKAPFYLILFETSICQFNSSKFYLRMPDEVREHPTRDQRPFLHPGRNHSRPFRFPAPCWCFFSSVHLIYFLQGSGQRTGMAIVEAWFCAQWLIFVLFLRFVFGLLYSWKIQTWPIHNISNRVSHLLIFLSVSIWCNPCV